MATSGSADFTITRDQLITEALEHLGAVDANGSPNVNDINSASRTLNLLVKALQTDRIFLRFVDEQTLSLVNATAAYDTDAGTLRVLDAWLRISGQDYPLEFIDMETYDAQVSKTTAGQPSKIYVDYAPTLPKVYLLPVPNASFTLHYKRERAVEDFDATANNPDFPVKAQEMLVFGLAHRLGSKYGLSLSERQYFLDLFDTAKKAYRAGDTQRTSRNIVAPVGVV